MISTRTLPKKIFYAMIDMDGAIYNSKYFHFLHLVILRIIDNKIDFTQMSESEKWESERELIRWLDSATFNLDAYNSNWERIKSLAESCENINLYNAIDTLNNRYGLYVYQHVLAMYDHAPDLYKRILYNSNEGLFQFIRYKVSDGEFDAFYMCSATNRLTSHHDFLAVKQNGTGQACIDLTILSGLFSEYLNVEVVLRRFTTPDIFNNQIVGTNFNHCLSRFGQHPNTITPSYYYDCSKFTIITASLADLLGDYQRVADMPEIYAHFFDDDDEIHKKLCDFFPSSHDLNALLPSNVRLYCHPYYNGGFHYWGDDYLSFVKGMSEGDGLTTAAVKAMSRLSKRDEYSIIDSSLIGNQLKFLHWRESQPILNGIRFFDQSKLKKPNEVSCETESPSMYDACRII